MSKPTNINKNDHWNEKQSSKTKSKLFLFSFIVILWRVFELMIIIVSGSSSEARRAKGSRLRLNWLNFVLAKMGNKMVAKMRMVSLNELRNR